MEGGRKEGEKDVDAFAILERGKGAKDEFRTREKYSVGRQRSPHEQNLLEGKEETTVPVDLG